MFIKGLFCDGACALDKQREKDRLSDPKSRPAGESEAGEECIGLAPREKIAKKECTLQKKTYAICLLSGKKINRISNQIPPV